MSRPLSQLDPMPSPAELLRIRDERLARRPDLQYLRASVARVSTSSEVAKAATPRTPAKCKARPREVSTPATAERNGDTLRLVLHVAPRTKKNGKQHYTRQSPAYVKFRDRVLELLAPIVTALQLPLPEQHYNIAAVYYVDRAGEQADKVGLDQGLYDVLENADVIGDDWFFRTADGTRVVVGDPSPRVELVITPLAPLP